MAQWESVRPQNMREQGGWMGRGATLAVVATAALFAIVALTAPQQNNALQQVQLAKPLPSWSASSAVAQMGLKSQALQLQLQAPPVQAPPMAAPPQAPPMAARPQAPPPLAAAPPKAPPAAFAPLQAPPVAAAPPPVPAPVAPVAAVAPAPVAVAPPRPAMATPQTTARLSEPEAEAPKPFNADLDNGGARSFGMQKTEDGKKDWSTISQVHGGKTMAQAGGMGSAGPATAEAGLDETLEDYQKVKVERRQAMDFCSGKFNAWKNIQKCIFLLLKNAHY